MKKTLFSLLLATIMAGCVSNEPKTENSINGEEAPVRGYLSIKLVAPGGTFTKANGQYQYGTADENYVNSVRFFFFDDQGNAVAIRKNPVYTEGSSAPEYFSYYDWSPTPSENQQGQQGEEDDKITDTNNSGDLGEETIEKVLTAMVVLTGQDGVFPTQVVAVLNPNNYVTTLVNPSLSTLQGASSVKDYLTGLTDKNFVMTNSAYIDKYDEIVVAQEIEEKNFGKTQPQAMEEPLVIYVERVVARLDLDMKIEYPEDSGLSPKTINDGATTIYPVNFNFTSEDRNYDPSASTTPEYDDVPIYAKFLGWAVTSTPVSSNLLKNISAVWGSEDELFGVINEPWYIYQYHRSFWAMNPSSITSNPAQPDASYLWYSFDEVSGNTTPQTPGCFPMTTLQTYMQENANPWSESETAANPQEPTKVLYAAQLVDGDGKAVTIAEWNGVYLTLSGLKNLAASMLDMYYYEGDAENGQYKPITGDQITFITSSQFHGRGPIFMKNNYYVYATLTSDIDNANDPIKNALGQKWYHLSDNVDPDKATAADYTLINSNAINSYMEAVFGNAQVWNNGYTYYYYEINHLGAKDYPGYWGVVRNHIYNATVTGLQGLGTPVWDTTEDIYPEHPSPDGNNLSAQVQILMWRLVSEDYQFEW